MSQRGYREHDECKDNEIRFYKDDVLISKGTCRYIGYIKCAGGEIEKYKEEGCYITVNNNIEFFIDYYVECDDVDKNIIAGSDRIEINQDYSGNKKLNMEVLHLKIYDLKSVEFSFTLKKYIH